MPWVSSYVCATLMQADSSVSAPPPSSLPGMGWQFFTKKNSVFFDFHSFRYEWSIRQWHLDWINCKAPMTNILSVMFEIVFQIMIPVFCSNKTQKLFIICKKYLYQTKEKWCSKLYRYFSIILLCPFLLEMSASPPSPVKEAVFKHLHHKIYRELESMILNGQLNWKSPGTSHETSQATHLKQAKMDIFFINFSNK